MSLETGNTAASVASRNGAPGPIQRAAVLGAGTMGVRIAAHLANAGLPVVLLDLTGNDGQATAAQSLQNLSRTKPSAFYDPAAVRLIQTGTFDHDLARLSECDWIVEAVTEDLAIKQALLARIVPFLKPGVTLTTNTSGLPVAAIAAKLPEHIRRCWFGTHFFNPPRYMRLLEIVPTPETEPAAMAAIADFAGRRLGKSVVYAHDTPNFIANRIGVFVMLQAMERMQEFDLTIEEVDALTGSALGWPRTGIFRLADMVGLDVLAHVVRNFAESGGGETLRVPPLVEALLERKWLGDKAGQGFYKKAKDGDGKEVRLVLDTKRGDISSNPQGLTYRPALRPNFPALEMARNVESLAERLRLLMAGDIRKDKAAAFYHTLLDRLFQYAANCQPQIAENPASVDLAMRAGFNWEMGPFEMQDALKLQTGPEGKSTWYREGGSLVFDPARGGYVPVARPAGVATVADYRRSHGVVQSNPGASLVDLGDGIAAIELHASKDAVGEDVTRLVTGVLQPASESVRNFQGFVLTGDRTNFSVGANLFQVLLLIQEQEWEDLDLAVRAFQRMTAAIKFCPRPVVVAPFGLCLGGGAEIALHATRRQAHAELYMGLVETGVGVVPAGGGTKEMVLRAMQAAQETVPWPRLAGSPEYCDALKRNFETIAMAKVSTSAAEARGYSYLDAADRITVHRDRLLLDAKEAVLALANCGYAPPVPKEIPAAGESVLATLKLGVHLMRQAEFISDHDQKIAHHAAHILCGGSVPTGTLAGEQYFLDLERQAFLSLCGERKTQERIAFTLKSGKPLRN